MQRKYLIPASAAVVAALVLSALLALRSNFFASMATGSSNVRQLKPRVVLEQCERDLGVLDPADKCRHTFMVRNEGDAPLKIVKAGASCKCTVSVLPSRDIPPGMGGPIEIESRTEGIEGPFYHAAAFRTNDPRTPRFELAIHGRICRYVATSPPSIYATGLKRGEPVELSALIYSEAWDDFSLTNSLSTIEGLSWELRPASPERLENRHARSGYLVVFRLPANRTETSFSGRFEADAQPIGEKDDKLLEKTRKVRVALAGKAAAIRTVYGPQIDRNGVVYIGILGPGESGRAILLLKVRGDHRRIRILDARKSPDFLKAEVFAESEELAEKGLYKIVVEVSADAPPGSHMAPEQMGTLRIVTDHPEMPEIVELKIAFAVMSE